MEDQTPNYPSQPQPPPPATPQPPHSPTTAENPPPPPPPPIPPSPSSQYPPPVSQNAYSASTTMTYQTADPNQMQAYNHSQGRTNYNQNFQNNYQPSQNNSHQYGPGLGRGEANKTQKQGQQLWHRMKRKTLQKSFYFYIFISVFDHSSMCLIVSVWGFGFVFPPVFMRGEKKERSTSLLCVLLYRGTGDGSYEV